MIFMVHTKDSFYKVDDPIEYINKVEAVNGHEACKKARKKHPDRVFINWWKMNIPCSYTRDTAGIIYCDKCGQSLNK